LGQLAIGGGLPGLELGVGLGAQARNGLREASAPGSICLR
jgi:hypothetical protein